MPITRLSTQQALAKAIERKLAERKERLARRLAYIGEGAVNEARDKGSYTDRTGNLRASVAYCVLMDGKRYAYSSSRPTSSTGKALELVVSAGMHYAPYVAAMGYDVLDSAEVKAVADVSAIKGVER